MAQLSRAGELKAIWVPTEGHEAMRNLWRTREDADGHPLRHSDFDAFEEPLGLLVVVACEA